ncbi:hypothetical protein BGX21_004659 [Mortierella sp. AD011]|nr:hypothetical protein BGX20_010996 [Mortierella sp. AD010]KAF9400271.1 hypothetical protein BGX21_004659 [Mortierella sp. AD011]
MVLKFDTADGRTLTLRAKKDLELERWYFILSKLWHYQQLQQQQPQSQQPQHPFQVAGRPEKDLDVEQQKQQQQHLHVSHSPNRVQRDLIPAASLLPAHQQSVHLFNKYLKRQHYHQGPEEYQPVQLHSPPQQQQRPVHPLQYQPNEVSHLTYLPQSLDWTQKNPEEDDDDDDDEDEGTGEGEDGDDEEEDIRAFLKTPDHNTALLPSQPTGWPINGILEPAKAAAIDMWRRNLLTPLMRRMPRSIYSDESESLVQSQLSRVKVMLSPRRPSGTRSLDLARACLQVGGNEEQINVRGPGQKYRDHSNWTPSKEPYARTRLASVSDDPCRDNHKQQKSSQDDDNLPLAMVRPRQGLPGCKDVDNTCHQQQQQQQQQQRQLHFDIGGDTEDTLPGPESPRVSRFSRWRRTQLSSEDESGTNRDSSVAFTTPDLSRNSFSMFPSRDSYLNLTNRDRGSYLNISNNSINPLDPAPTPSRSSFLQSGKKRILTSILKRPSLPSLDTAVLAAAVGTTRTPVFATETINSSSSSIDYNGLSSSFTDLSLSVHGSSYSYLPNFVSSNQADVLEALNDSEHSASESIHRSSPPSPSLSSTNSSTVAAHVPKASTVTPTTEAKPASPLPLPPVRPPRRRPITARWSKNAQEGSKGKANVPPVAPRRNSAPATVFLNVGLGIDLSQTRQSDTAQSPCTMKVRDRNPQVTKEIEQKQEQELSKIVVGTVSLVNDAHGAIEEKEGGNGNDGDDESVLSDESFCYF